MERHLWNILDLINDVIIPFHKTSIISLIATSTLEVSQCTARVFARLSRPVKSGHGRK